MTAQGHRRRRPSAHRGGRRARAARGRQRRRRRGRRDAHVVGGRAAAHRARAPAATCSSPGAGEEPTLLDFFVAAPGRGADGAQRAPSSSPRRGRLRRRGPGLQRRRGVVRRARQPGRASREAARRWGTMPLAELAAPAGGARARGRRRQRRAGVHLRDPRAASSPRRPRRARCSRPTATLLREGDVFRSPELGDTIERLGAEGAAPFYDGRRRRARSSTCVARARRDADRARTSRAYAPVAREPVRARYRGRDVLTNPPPNAGGVLLALALARLDGRPTARRRCARSSTRWRPRRPSARPSSRPAWPTRRSSREFVASQPRRRRRTSRSWTATAARRRVTCTNGEGSGARRPGHRHPRQQHHGRGGPQPARLPPRRAGHADAVDDGPDRRAARRRGRARARLGRARTGSARRSSRSIVGVVDHGLAAQRGGRGAARALRGRRRLRRAGRAGRGAAATAARSSAFRDRNVFFGGAQAVERDPATGALTGAGDPRRGGVAVEA